VKDAKHQKSHVAQTQEIMVPQQEHPTGKQLWTAAIHQGKKNRHSH
jgi:hypothetical protein